MAFNNYPYADFNTLNLDWLIKTCLELRALIDSGLAEYFNAQLGNLFLTASYVPETKTLKFTIKEEQP